MLTKITKKCFEDLDLDNSGSITITEFQNFIYKLSSKYEIQILNGGDILKVFKQLESVSSKGVTVEDFKILVKEVLKQLAASTTI
jgi:Ca2+-binding EF-hand superfamily protein